MPEISKITLPSGTTYDIKDATARAAASGSIILRGETTTVLADNSTTNPVTINGESYTAVANDAVFYSHKEFVFDGTYWHEFGDMSGLGALATKDSASTDYTPAGSVSQPTFSGSETTSTGKFTPSGSVSVSVATSTTTAATVSAAASGTATYTPEGTVSAPTVSVSSAGASTTVNSITDVGTLPTLTTTVANETLTIGFSQGTLPTMDENISVKTGDASYTASAPTFTGTGARLVADDITVPATFTGSFTGTEGDVTVKGTPSGTVSQPTFTGTQATITVS